MPPKEESQPNSNLTRQNPILENIPQELKQFPQWVCWKAIQRKGKVTKPPINPHTLEEAQIDNPVTWATFEKAKQTFLSNQNLSGIGFVITKETNITGIDFDSCLSEDSKFIWGKDDIERLQSYTEYSPSGKGIHILAYGPKPGNNCRKGNVEMYCEGRYFTVTGRHIEGTPFTIEHRQEALNEIYHKYLETNGKQKPSQIFSSIPTDDESLIDKAMKAKNGAKFKLLWEGNWQGTYRSQSEAELALCSILAFWTQGDHSKIDQLFRKSGLYREKWDKKHGEKSYGEITIDKVLSNLTNTYSPQQTINTGERQTDQSIEVEHFTDMGNARRFVKACGGIVRYCYEWNSWLIWDGRRWLLDKTGEIFCLAKKTVQKIYEEAGKINNEALRKEAAKHALKSEARSRLEAMVALTQSEVGIPILTDQMDGSQWKINVLNGTIDLRNGLLLPHSKDDNITKLLPIEYDPKAKCELWITFLNKIMAGNQNLISFLKRAVGYSLTGDVSEQVLFFLYGTGANGKSKFLEAIMGVLSQYAIQAAPDILMMKQYESHPTGLADLFGKRFVACIETEEGKRLAESLVKQMTGGDRMKARFMRQDFFEFAPTFKIWLAANHKPIIRGNDYAIWRRIRLIPFEVTIPLKERDKRIGEKLQAEYPGILRWAVEGCLEWQRDGELKEPDEVIAATKTYQDEMDVFGRFLSEEAIQIPQAQVFANVLYTRYKAWCEENGESVVSGNAFGRRMTELGFTKERITKGYVYKNIGLFQKEEE